jgi:flagellar motor component MotA
MKKEPPAVKKETIEIFRKAFKAQKPDEYVSLILEFVSVLFTSLLKKIENDPCITVSRLSSELEPVGEVIHTSVPFFSFQKISEAQSLSDMVHSLTHALITFFKETYGQPGMHVNFIGDVSRIYNRIVDNIDDFFITVLPSQLVSFPSSPDIIEFLDSFNFCGLHGDDRKSPVWKRIKSVKQAMKKTENELFGRDILFCFARRIAYETYYSSALHLAPACAALDEAARQCFLMSMIPRFLISPFVHGPEEKEGEPLLFSQESGDDIDETSLSFNVKAAVEVLTGFASTARAEGLLALEDSIDTIPDKILQLGLRLICDGTEPRLVHTIMSNAVQAACEDIKKQGTILMNGLPGIQRGDNPGLIKQNLLAIIQPETESGQSRHKDLIDRIIFLSEKARREGLLAIEDDLGEIRHSIMRNGLQLIIEGTEPARVEWALKRMTERSIEEAQLFYSVLLYGTLMIQAGHTPEELTELLSLFIPFDELVTAGQHIPFDNGKETDMYASLRTSRDYSKLPAMFKPYGMIVLFSNEPLLFFQSLAEIERLLSEFRLNCAFLNLPEKTDVYGSALAFFQETVETLKNNIRVLYDKTGVSCNEIERKPVINDILQSHFTDFFHDQRLYEAHARLTSSLDSETEHFIKEATRIIEENNPAIENPYYHIPGSAVLRFMKELSRIYVEMKRTYETKEESFRQDIINRLKQSAYETIGISIDFEYKNDFGLDLLRKTILYRGETVDNLDELFSHETGRAVKKLIIGFDDIRCMDDRAIQKILREIDMATLVKALQGAETSIKEKIFSNMSERAVKLTEEDSVLIGDIDEREIQAARRIMVSMMYDLIDSGETGIPS